MAVDPKATLYAGVGVRLSARVATFGDPDEYYPSATVTLDALLHEGVTSVVPVAAPVFAGSLGVYTAVLDTTGLPAGRYVYRVRAVTPAATQGQPPAVGLHENEFVLQPVSVAQPTTPLPTTVPEPPVLHEVDALDGQHLVFRFDAPVGGPVPDHYVLYAVDPGSGVQQSATVGPTMPATLVGVFPAASYDCRMTAVSGGDLGVESDHVLSTVPAPPVVANN